MELKIKKIKFTKIGDSFWILIPMDYIKNNMVDYTKIYSGALKLKEVNNE